MYFLLKMGIFHWGYPFIRGICYFRKFFHPFWSAGREVEWTPRSEKISETSKLAPKKRLMFLPPWVFPPKKFRGDQLLGFLHLGPCWNDGNWNMQWKLFFLHFATLKSWLSSMNGQNISSNWPNLFSWPRYLTISSLSQKDSSFKNLNLFSIGLENFLNSKSVYFMFFLENQGVQ